jgi:hypothetical protein
MPKRVIVRFTVTSRGAGRIATDRNIRQIAEETRAAIVANTPRGRTGQLAGGWTIQPVRLAKYQVRNEVRYARHVEFGTRTRPPAAMMGRALAVQRARYGSRR